MNTRSGPLAPPGMHAHTHPRHMPDECVGCGRVTHLVTMFLCPRCDGQVPRSPEERMARVRRRLWVMAEARRRVGATCP